MESSAASGMRGGAKFSPGSYFRGLGLIYLLTANKNIAYNINIKIKGYKVCVW